MSRWNCSMASLPFVANARLRKERKRSVSLDSPPRRLGSDLEPPRVPFAFVPRVGEERWRNPKNVSVGSYKDYKELVSESRSLFEGSQKKNKMNQKSYRTSFRDMSPQPTPPFTLHIHGWINEWMDGWLRITLPFRVISQITRLGDEPIKSISYSWWLLTMDYYT